MSEMKHKKGDRFDSNHHNGCWLMITVVREQEYETVTEEDEVMYIDEGTLKEDYTKIEPSKQVETEYDGFKDMTESFGKMLNEKNKRYGNAALDPLVIIGKHHRLGAKIDEKLSRIMNADELKKNDLADVIGYCFLICKDKGWTNFDDQID